MESILISIKKLLGIADDDTSFDTDVIFHINSVFADLEQIMNGVPEHFTIEDDTSMWVDYLPTLKNLEAVKSYMYLRVKLLFDPPSSSAVIAAMQEEIKKWEWRLNVAAET